MDTKVLPLYWMRSRMWMSLKSLANGLNWRKVMLGGLNTIAGRLPFLILLAASTSSVSGGTPQFDAPMVFSERGSGGNCTDCLWIQAEGRIENGTAERFREFIGDRGCTHRRIVFNSPGGSLLGGLELGAAIRDAKCNTDIGVTTYHPDDGPNHATLDDGQCFSACVYAFMGGLHRAADRGDKIGVHQHYFEHALATPDIPIFSSIDLSETQVLDGILVAYARSMGVDPLIVSLASQVPPDQPILVMDLQTLANLQVVTDHWVSGVWELEVQDNTLVAVLQQRQDYDERTVWAQFECANSGRGRKHSLSLLLPVDDHWLHGAEALMADRRVGLKLRFGTPAKHMNENYSFFSRDGEPPKVGFWADKPVYKLDKAPDGSLYLLVTIPLDERATRALYEYQGLLITPDTNLFSSILMATLSLSGLADLMPFVLAHCGR